MYYPQIVSRDLDDTYPGILGAKVIQSSPGLLDDTHPGILGAKPIHQDILEDSWTSGYSHTKRSHSTQITRQNTDHEDGIVSGDTMNVYIPLYAPDSDMNAFIKPSVISIQPLV